MNTEPKLTDRKEQPCVGIRTQVTLQEFGSGIIPKLLGEGIAWLQKQGKTPTGAPYVRYHTINMTDKLDVEMGWPVASTLSGDGRVTADVLPAGRYASLIYTGPYDGLMEANRVLIEWAKEKGIEWDTWDTPAGQAFRSRYESYFTDPGKEPDPQKWETEVAIKVADK